MGKRMKRSIEHCVVTAQELQAYLNQLHTKDGKKSLRGALNCPEEFNLTVLGIDLKEKNLSDADFSYTSIWRGDFTKSTCPGTYFIRTYMYEAKLILAEFQHADFTTASLLRASLLRGNFMGANFTGTDLSHTKLCGGNFIGVNVTDATFTHATFSDHFSRSCFIGAVGFTEAQKRNARENGAIVEPKDLRYAINDGSITHTAGYNFTKSLLWLANQEKKPELKTLYQQEAFRCLKSIYSLPLDKMPANARRDKSLIDKATLLYQGFGFDPNCAFVTAGLPREVMDIICGNILALTSCSGYWGAKIRAEKDARDKLLASIPALREKC